MSQTPFRIIRTPRTIPVPQTPPDEPSMGHAAARNGGFIVARGTHYGVCPEIVEWDSRIYEAERAARAALDQANHHRPGWRIYALTDITERPSE